MVRDMARDMVKVMESNSETKDANHYTRNAEYAYFCRKVTELTGINLSNYKSKQMYRRLLNYMRRRQIPDFLIFAKRVAKEPGELDRLVDYLTINVSEFFRNAEQWKILRDKVIPGLATLPASNIARVWSAGCSAGQEAYSAAIAFAEAWKQQVFILGTDIDEPSLKKAREGRYSGDEVKNVSDRLLRKHFRLDGGLYVVNDTLKKTVSFEKHNLLGSDYPCNMDLILCRNVLIYFTDEGQEHVISGLASSLRPGGVLFMGATEAIFKCKEYGLSQICPFFYQRIP